MNTETKHVPLSSDESRMRLLVDKRQLLADTILLQGMLDEYCTFLGTTQDAPEWTQQAQSLLRKHGQFLDQTRLSLQSLELASTLVRQVLALRPGEYVEIPTTQADRPADLRPIHPAPPHRPGISETRRLIAQINGLSSRAPLAIQQKLRLLLDALLRLLEMPAAESIEFEQVLAEVNLLTSNRESRHLVREVARLARDVYNSVNAMSESFPVDLLVETKDGASEAVRKLRSVIARLEQTATRNLDELERLSAALSEDDSTGATIGSSLRRILRQLADMKRRHPDFSKAIDDVLDRLGNDVAGAVMQISFANRQQSEAMLGLISRQSFQDLTSATLKKIIVFIEALQFQLVAVLDRYRSVLSLAQADIALSSNEPASQPQPVTESSQDQVDQLLTRLGF